MFARLVGYVRGIARRRRIYAEVDDELRFHIEQETESHIRRGVSPTEARRIALRDFGGVTPVTQAVREVRTIWPDLLWRDARHAVRSLRRTPAFSSVALVVLTLSIGATTAIFGAVDAVILRGLPFPTSGRLVAVGELNVKDRAPSALNLTTPQTFLDWRDQQDVFTGLAAVAYAEISLKREPNVLPENVRAQRVTADFFSVLQTQPVLGRPFSREDERDGRRNVAVISYSLWQRRFGGNPDVIGAYLPGQQASFEVVGVMPPRFSYPVDTYVRGPRQPTDVWVPYVFSSDDRVRGNRYGYNLHVVGRLRDGVSIERAQARMSQIAEGLAAQTPRWYTDRAVKVEPLHEFVTGRVRSWMMMLLAGVAFVLLIACVNLANLMLLRATARTRELGIRAALGGSRWDLSRVLLLESLILSLTGAALGAALAWWGVDLLRPIVPAEVPRAATIAVDVRVLATMGIVAILAGVAFGMAPVWKCSRPTIAGMLIQAERTGTATIRTKLLRSTLVVAEIALAVVLLVGSGLFLASFARVTNVDLGLDPHDVLTVRVRVLESPADIEQAARRNHRLLMNVLDRIRAIPGVAVASLAGGGLPLRADLVTVPLGIPGRELPRHTDIALNEITPDYFRVLKVPLLRGRVFAETDIDTSEPVVILNHAAAARYFPKEDAVGRVIRLVGNRTVVGVVGDIRHDGPEGGWRTQAFIPLSQSRVSGATLVVRTTPGAKGILPAVRQAIWSELPDTLPTRVDEHDLTYYFDALVAQRRFNMLLLALFGALGLSIASVGIYGVIGYVVSQRTQEIGIRMALGAQPSTILKSVLGGALLTILVGIAIGLIGAWGLSGLVGEFLFEVQPHDPRVYAGALLLLATTGLAAAFGPARRASSVDPLIALRME
ncbi:MAG TPA: ABC transporter permease [Nitrospiraceae bacterium]|nr:ABC transporter permease [Nitrospiraceae bacterium]